MSGKMIAFLFHMICFAVICTVSAYADYIDPSAVTYTAQAIAAVVVALGALATDFRHKIAALFKKNRGETAKREIHLKNEEQAAEKTDNQD